MLWVLAALVVAGVLATELTLRLTLGLGNPVLYEPHDTIEYLPQPDQHGARRGNRFFINRYGMRSDDFPADKADDELRVLVLGDSVIFGGSPTDQYDLPTEIAKRLLEIQIETDARFTRVTVGNISAGSWGPPNHLAYLEAYGLFDADVVVLVLSSHDAGDVPEFRPVETWSIGRPHTRPWSAIGEVLDRLALGWRSADDASALPPGVIAATDDPGGALPALNRIAELCRQAGVELGIVLYQRRPEVLGGQPEPGYALLRNWWEHQHELGRVIPTLGDTTADFAAAGPPPFRDDWHPDQRGHEILAQHITQLVAKAMLDRDAAPPR